LPLTPVANIVRETVERTTAAWQVLDHRDLLPADIRKAVGDHIESASARTGKTL